MGTSRDDLVEPRDKYFGKYFGLMNVTRDGSTQLTIEDHPLANFALTDTDGSTLIRTKNDGITDIIDISTYSVTLEQGTTVKLMDRPEEQLAGQTM